MHRRQSLAYRPKTSSALDDDDRRPAPLDHIMKRTASQTFTTSHYHDVRDTGAALDAVSEGSAAGPSQPSSLLRAFDAVTGSFTRTKSRRRLSSFSSASTVAPRRRGSLQSFIEALPSTTATRKSSIEQQRQQLPHQDSGLPSFQLQPQAQPFRPAFYKRLGSMRRRTITPTTALDQLHVTYPSQQIPGAAARQAAAAANQDRHNQRREQDHMDHTHRFLHGLLEKSVQDGELKDNESGIDMTCASDTVRADSVTDKKMSMSSLSISL
jgi:F-box and WD-40 domain protein 1/11